MSGNKGIPTQGGGTWISAPLSNPSEFVSSVDGESFNQLLFNPTIIGAVIPGPESGIANVLDFGADPTGVADSSGAINAAAASVAPNGLNKSVYLPTGTYHIRHQIRLTNGQSLFGVSWGNTIITVSDDFDPTPTSVIMVQSSGIDPGPTISHLYILFAQPSDISSRSTFKTLAAGGTSGTGGTGVQYPWAISSVANAGRIALDHVRIGGAWDGITTNGQQVIYWGTSLQIGALNCGMNIASGFGAGGASLDFAKFTDVEFWPFGLTTTGQQSVFLDGSTVAMMLGAQNGFVASGISCFASQIQITPDALFGGWFDFTNLALDGDAATMIVYSGSWLHVSNLYHECSAAGVGRPALLLGGGISVTLNNVFLSNNSADTQISVTNGDVTIQGAYIIAGNATAPVVQVSNGTLRLAGVKINGGLNSTAYTHPMVEQSGSGVLQVFGLDVSGGTSSSGTAVKIGQDNLGNFLGQMTLGTGWTNDVTAIGGPPYSGIYGPFASTFAPTFTGLVTSLGITYPEGGLSFGTNVGSSPTDLSKHITLYPGYGIDVTSGQINYIVPSGQEHAFYVGGSNAGWFTNLGVTGVSQVQVGFSGPTWTQGDGVPSSTQPVGSIYSRVGGSIGSTLYVSRGGGTWNAVAGV